MHYRIAVLNPNWFTDAKRLSNHRSQCGYISSTASRSKHESSPYHKQSLNRFTPDSTSFSSIHCQAIKQTRKMIGSPLEADPLPGTSRFYTSQRDAHMPPPYASQQPPPPYPSCTPTPKATIPQPSTRSVPFGHGVTFEWNSALPSSPDDIIIVTVRTNQLGLSRRQSFDDPLPERYVLTFDRIPSISCSTC